MIRVLVFVAVGVVLLLANLWFILRVKRAFFSSDAPDTIAPFQILGQDDPQGKNGTSLAMLLQARLSRVRQEIVAARSALQSAGQVARLYRPLGPAVEAGPDARAVLASSLPLTYEVPLQLVPPPPELTLKVGQVELGGIVSWFFSVTSQDRPLRVVVQTGQNKSVVGVGSDGDPDRAFWLETAPDNASIIQSVAYAIWQKEMAKEIEQVDAFNPDEFGKLIEILNLANDYLRRESYGREDKDQWKELAKDLDPLTKKVSGWPDLLLFAALVATKAGVPQDAITNLTRGRDLYLERSEDTARTDKSLTASRLRDLSEALRILQGRQATAPAAVGPPPLTDWALRRSIGIADEGFVPARPIRVAVFGGLPDPNGVKDLKYEVISSGVSRPDPNLGPYLAKIAQTVHRVAPEVEFLFAGIESQSVTSIDIVASFNSFVGHKTDIILYTFHFFDDPAMGVLFSSIKEKNILILVAAARVDRQETSPFVIVKDATFVAALDDSGQIAPYSKIREGVIWAPGDRIPVRDEQGKEVSGQGLSYATAARRRGNRTGSGRLQERDEGPSDGGGHPDVESRPWSAVERTGAYRRSEGDRTAPTRWEDLTRSSSPRCRPDRRCRDDPFALEAAKHQGARGVEV